MIQNLEIEILSIKQQCQLLSICHLKHGGQAWLRFSSSLPAGRTPRVVASRSQRSYPAAGIFHSSSSRQTRGAASSSSRRTCSAATLIQQLRHGNSQPTARIQTPANQGQRHQQLSIQRRGVANVVAEATVLFRDASNCDKWSVAAGPRCARCVSNRVSRCERDQALVCVLEVVRR